MNNKKLGTMLLIISLLLFFIFLSYNYKLGSQSKAKDCNPTKECTKISALISLTNIFIGIIFSLVSLGFYILFFNKDEELLLKKIGEGRKEITKEQKFDIMLNALSPQERQIIQIIREEEGITQVMLRIRSDFSKTKLSFVLADLEKKELIKKEIYGKTNKIYLKGGIFSFSKPT